MKCSDYRKKYWAALGLLKLKVPSSRCGERAPFCVIIGAGQANLAVPIADDGLRELQSV